MKFGKFVIIVLVAVSLFFGVIRILTVLIAPGSYESIKRGWRYSIIQKTEVDLMHSKIIVTTKINDNSIGGYVYNAFIEDKVYPEQVDSVKKVQIDSMKVKLKELVELKSRMK